MRCCESCAKYPESRRCSCAAGIRYDYMLCDKSGDFFSELVRYHISGQLKVAPEHCIDSVLDYMGKPHIDVYERFMDKYRRLNQRYDKEQYVVPYLMSSHPGSTLESAISLAEFLHRTGRRPEQVQDFYPTPGTISTCMYYTGIDPRDMSEVYVARSAHEKAMQRALLQIHHPGQPPPGHRGSAQGGQGGPHRLRQGLPGPARALREKGRKPRQASLESRKGRRKSRCKAVAENGRGLRKNRVKARKSPRRVAAGRRADSWSCC